MPDSPYPIQVKVEITVDKLKPLTDTVKFGVDALFQCVIDIPGVGATATPKPVEVDIMPPGLAQPALILVKPVKVGDDEDAAKINDQLRKSPLSKSPPLEYATMVTPPDKDHTLGQRKPITGTHVFYNGMAEWVTDMVKDGVPGRLTKLVFWNNLKPAPDKTDADKAAIDCTPAKTISVLVIVGYTPIPASSVTAQSCPSAAGSNR